MTLPEVGKVAGSAIEAMRTNPSCLAALLVVAMFAALMYFDSRAQSRSDDIRISALQKILETCVVNQQ